jgi:two-component sensor histidine kinase
VARVPNPETTVGKMKASPSLLKELFKKEEDKVRTTSLEGVDLLTAYSRSPVTQWIVAAGIPVDQVTAPLWRSLALTAAIGIVLLGIGLAFAIRMAQEVARGEALQKLMVNELNHRVKNTLATVQSMAGQTFRNAINFVDARDKFDARLVALGRAHEVLSDQRWLSADLHEIVDGVFVPLGVKGSTRIAIRGPATALAPRTALMVSMVLHELATNAVKYGSLSNSDGRVTIDWSLSTVGKEKCVDLRWRESGGPKVTPPAAKGFGSRLIEQSVVAQLHGKAELVFADEGLRCEIQFPVD